MSCLTSLVCLLTPAGHVGHTWPAELHIFCSRAAAAACIFGTCVMPRVLHRQSASYFGYYHPSGLHLLKDKGETALFDEDLNCFAFCLKKTPQLLNNTEYDNTLAKEQEGELTAALLIALPLSRRVWSLSRAFLDGLGSLGR